MKFPSVFINHGGGPLPLMGRQPELVENMREVVRKFLPPKPPKAIVVISAHWEADPIQITSAERPKMYYDYYNFPPETYKYEYPAPGSPDLASKIKNLLEGQNLKSELDDSRGFDHGVFIPLMIMYPEADIPVVCVSLHGSLSAQTNINIGKALAPLRDEEILLMGSGYTFHNMGAFFNPSQQTIKASQEFNQWLKSTITTNQTNIGMNETILHKLGEWDDAPGGRLSHPREEHILPLFVVAGASLGDHPRVIYDTIDSSSSNNGQSEHAVTGYLFQ